MTRVPTSACLESNALGNSVLIVGNFLSASGGSRGVCEDLAERLSGRNWRVLTTSDKRSRVPRLLDMVSTTWKRRREYQIAQVDVYSGNAFFWAEAVCWTLRRIGKPYILTLHGGALPEFAKRFPNRVRRLLTSASAVTSPSRYLQNQLRTYRSDIRTIPNPIDLDAYQFVLREHPLPRLIWLRAFHSTYNPVMAVEVLARLSKTIPAVALTMIGPDKGDGTLAAVRSTARELGVESQLTIELGVPKREVPARLQKGDIFLNTTNYESFGVSVIEAAACGLPIVSTDAGELPYLWTDGVDAAIVHTNDAESMATAVERILQEPGLAGQRSVNARAKAAEFDWAAILPRWEELLKRVAGPKTAPALDG